MSLDWLPGLDPATATFTLPLWLAGVAAALFLVLIVIAVMRAGVTEFGGMVFRVAVILIAVVFGWTYITRTADRDRADERRALDSRATELIAGAIAPGSAIACLEAANAETVEGSCERAVFAGPETVAAATAYIGARLSLLADAHEFQARRDQAYETQLGSLRRTIAADRYGLASQVLAARDGCTADACEAFGFVYDDKKLRANMRDRLFDITLARYAANWPTRTRPLASGNPSAPVTSSSSGTPITPPGPNVQFPSSQSIPPVSIMTAEPPAPSPPPQSQAGASDAPPPTNTAPASATKKSSPPR
ncbi:MAG TPA: hypothetical protein VJT13_22915, partial [Xanthobacteraceae bacterium]|nr:hypothetical protein [Xanthobacteraceae bacterium]